MKLEQQVCSLELAKRLKELGVRQESAFYWFAQGDAKYLHDHFNPLIKTCVSAFTVAELGEMLPKGHDFISYHTVRGPHRIDFNSGSHGVNKSAWFEAHTESDARAAMLVHLIEKGIVKL